MLLSNTTLNIWNSSQKYPIKAILVPKLKIFFFGRNFVFRQIWGCWWKIRYYSSFFEFQPINTHIRQFWFYISKKCFIRNITFLQTEGAEVKHDNSFFNFLPKIKQIRYFQCNLKFFYLHENLYECKFTSWKTKLLPKISKLCHCNCISCFLY